MPAEVTLVSQTKTVRRFIIVGAIIGALIGLALLIANVARWMGVPERIPGETLGTLIGFTPVVLGMCATGGAAAGGVLGVIYTSIKKAK